MTVPFQRSITLWGAVVMFTFLAVSTSQAQSCRSGFAGEWETTYGRLTLSVSGDEVWGVYGTNNRISGRVYGRALEGRWEYPNGRWGRLRFSHDGYGKFTGNWGEKDGNMNARWTGVLRWWCGAGSPALPALGAIPANGGAPGRSIAFSWFRPKLLRLLRRNLEHQLRENDTHCPRGRSAWELWP